MFIHHANLPAGTSSISEKNSTNTNWMDVKTLGRIKGLGLKRKFRGCRDGRNKARPWSSNKAVHQHLLWTLLIYNITKWHHTLIRTLLINIQSIKSKLDAPLHHITLNDIDICFITETWINTDNDLQLLEANISGLEYRIINKHRENQSGGGVACIYKGHLNIQMYTMDNTYTFFWMFNNQTYGKMKTSLDSIIYRPPYSNRHPISTYTFIDEFPDHLSHLLCQTDNWIIVGDINIPWNK